MPGAQDVDAKIFACPKVLQNTRTMATQTSTSGGASDTEVKELAVIPCAAPEASRTVATVIPLANLPQIRRNCCFSILDIAGGVGLVIGVEFTTYGALTGSPRVPLL